MSKIILKFLKPYTRYNAGDVAGFDDLTADRLIAGKVAVKHTPKTSTSTVALTAGADAEAAMAEVRKVALEEQDRLQKLADGIQQRETESNAKLEAREKALAEREKALDAREKKTGEGTRKEGETGPEPANSVTPQTGEGNDLPEQGNKKAK